MTSLTIGFVMIIFTCSREHEKQWVFSPCCLRLPCEEEFSLAFFPDRRCETERKTNVEKISSVEKCWWCWMTADDLKWIWARYVWAIVQNPLQTSGKWKPLSIHEKTKTTNNRRDVHTVELSHFTARWSWTPLCFLTFFVKFDRAVFQSFKNPEI